MISQEEIKHIAQLAHLSLSQDELKKMEKELSVILNYFNSLKEIDVSKVKPAFYSEEEKALSLQEITRPDVTREEKGLEEQLRKTAPYREGDFFKVRKVI
jgi:aspartyl-tRNA(Asn)/glutamyl-tRNA(Gln) amidotransferase subunit C